MFYFAHLALLWESQRKESMWCRGRAVTSRGVERQPAATGLCGASTEAVRPFKWGAVLTVFSSTSMKNFTTVIWREVCFQLMLKKFSPCFTETCLSKAHLITNSCYIQRCFRKLWNAIWKIRFLSMWSLNEQRRWNVLSGDSMWLRMNTFPFPLTMHSCPCPIL